LAPRLKLTELARRSKTRSRGAGATETFSVSFSAAAAPTSASQMYPRLGRRFLHDEPGALQILDQALRHDLRHDADGLAGCSTDRNCPKLFRGHALQFNAQFESRTIDQSRPAISHARKPALIASNIIEAPDWSERQMSRMGRVLPGSPRGRSRSTRYPTSALCINSSETKVAQTKTAAESPQSKNEKAPRRSSAGQDYTSFSAVGTTRVRYTADALRGR
jgi:hypothetical protein